MAEIKESSYKYSFTNLKRSRFPGPFGGWNRPTEGDGGRGLSGVRYPPTQPHNHPQDKKDVIQHGGINH